MEALRQAGLRISKRQNNWAQEMADMPGGVMYGMCKERYLRILKDQKSPEYDRGARARFTSYNVKQCIELSFWMRLE